MGDLNEGTSLEEWDEIFLNVTKDIFAEVCECSRENVKQVLLLSKNFLEHDAHKSVKEFYDLYFGAGEKNAKAEQFNEDISQFVKDLQEKMQDGEDISQQAIEDNSGLMESLELNASDRLRLAQIQKQMESLIALDQSLKDKLAPIMASMQFEDLMRQRLEHIQKGYELTIALKNDAKETDIFGVIAQLESLCSSESETREFFEEVKHEEPPKGLQLQGTVFKF